MSLFIGQSSQYSTVNVNPEKIKYAEIQFSAMSETFNKIMSTCEKKCLPHEYGEGDLVTGENSCIDRCVSKYVKSNVIIGTNFQNNGVNPYKDMPEYKKINLMLEEVKSKNSN